MDRLVARESFSRFLPFVGYDDHHQVYRTMDNGVGYLFEIQPVAFASDSVVQAMSGLANISFSDKTVVQIILMADPYIGDILDDYIETKTRADALVTKNAVQFVSHIVSQQSGLDQMYGIPIRNFRCFVAIKSPDHLPADTLSVTEEALRKFGCRRVPPDGKTGLLVWMRRMFSDMRMARADVYDQTKPLNKQIIDAGAVTDFERMDAKIGKHFARCLTPKAMPKEITPQMVNRLCGGMMGLMDDPEQVTGPFLISLNITFGGAEAEITKKSQIMSAQKAGGAVAHEIARMVNEYHWAVDYMKSDKFVRVIPTIWVFGYDQDQCRDNASRVMRLYETLKFSMQEEDYLNKVLFILSLPFGLYLEKGNIDLLERDFYLPVETAGVLAPVQGDFRGAGRPVQVFIGRKGQIGTFDLFGVGGNNYNFVVSAESGGGKSFLLNNMLFQYYAAGAAVRIIDIGGSYEKACKIFGGRYIDIGKENVVLNPFDFEAVDEEEEKISIQAAADVLALMATSASGVRLSEEQLNLLKSAARWVFKTERCEEGVDAAREYLATYPQHAPDIEKSAANVLADDAHKLAFNLQDYCTEGDYGRFFNGKSTLRIKQDDFVVVELERLRGQKQLFSTMVMQILNVITQDLYLSERERPRFILFEEAASFLKESMAGSMSSTFAGVIEAGFRRARKYNGSFGVVLQSVLDLPSFGDVGHVIMENAATKFYLQGSSYGLASERKIIPYDGFALKLLQSVRSNPPHYSEIFIDSPAGCGVARLVVDKHSYWVNTSHPNDVLRFNRLCQLGLSPAEAIDALVDGREDQVLAKRLAPPNDSEKAVAIAQGVAAE